MSKFRFLMLVLTVLLLSEPGFAQHETIYMSVLNSRKHRLGAMDNPTVGLFISTDAGVTWQHKGWRGYIRTFYAEAGPDGTMWSACGNGVFRSADHGETWRLTTGWEMTEVLKVRVNPADPSTVYAATAYGIFVTSDNGITWKARNSGLRVPFTSDLLIDISDTKRIFAATEYGIYRSMNEGKNWSLTGIEGKGIRVLAQDHRNPNILWAGTEDDGVFRSTDGGKSWHPLNLGLDDKTVYAVAIDPTDSRTIYLGTHGGGVYRSTDNGKNWSQKKLGLTNLEVHAITILPSRPEIVFAGTLNGGLFRSTNRGESWEFNSQEGAQVWGLSVR